MAKKALLCYGVDVFLFLVGVISAFSGFVLMAGGEGGYRGGRGEQATQLSLDRHTWQTLHEISSIALVAGVIVHILLHWRWIVQVTKAIFKPEARKAEVCPPEIEGEKTS